MKKLQKLFLSAGGAGFLPVAPGTWGSIVGSILLVLTSLYYDIEFSSSPIFIAVIVVVFFLGVHASRVVESEWGEDPPQTVIDEVIGVWITMVFIPYTWYYTLIGLVLFRVFDIWKPLLIRKMEYAGSGWGVMLDDVLAGVYANVVLNVIVIGFNVYGVSVI